MTKARLAGWYLAAGVSLIFMVAAASFYIWGETLSAKSCMRASAEDSDIVRHRTVAGSQGLRISTMRDARSCHAVNSLVNANPDRTIAIDTWSADDKNRFTTLEQWAYDIRNGSFDIVFAPQKTISFFQESGLLIDPGICQRIFDKGSLPPGAISHALTNTIQWAHPVTLNPVMLAYNQGLLKKIGWTTNEINTLHERIAAGEFTLEDLLETGRKAVAEGVIESEKVFLPLDPKSTIASIYESYSQSRVDVTHFNTIELLAIDQTLSFLSILSNEKLVFADLLSPTKSIAKKSFRHDAVQKNKVLFALLDAHDLEKISSFKKDKEYQTALDPEYWGLTLLPSGVAYKPAVSVNMELGYFAVFNRRTAKSSVQLAACQSIVDFQQSELFRNLPFSHGIPVVSENRFILPEGWPALASEQLEFPSTENKYWNSLFETLQVKSLAINSGDITHEAGIRAFLIDMEEVMQIERIANPVAQ